MANLVKNTLSFTPKVMPDWFYKVLLKPNFIEKDYIRVEANVTKEAVLRKLVMSGNTVSQVDNRDCSWTPKECFRLQGFPDDYYERAAQVCSDSQLYKQAGNSVTVNVIYEIAKRLEGAYEK